METLFLKVNNVIMTQQQVQYAYWQRMRQNSLRNYVAQQIQGIGSSEEKVQKLSYKLTLNHQWNPPASWHYYINGVEQGDHGTWNTPMNLMYEGDRLKIVITNLDGVKVTKFVTKSGDKWDHSDEFTFDDDYCYGEFTVGKEDAGKDLLVIAYFERI